MIVQTLKCTLQSQMNSQIANTQQPTFQYEILSWHGCFLYLVLHVFSECTDNHIHTCRRLWPFMLHVKILRFGKAENPVKSTCWGSNPQSLNNCIWKYFVSAKHKNLSEAHVGNRTHNLAIIASRIPQPAFRILCTPVENLRHKIDTFAICTTPREVWPFVDVQTAAHTHERLWPSPTVASSLQQGRKPGQGHNVKSANEPTITRLQVRFLDHYSHSTRRVQKLPLKMRKCQATTVACVHVFVWRNQ